MPNDRNGFIKPDVPSISDTLSPALQRTLAKDKEYLENTDLPIITVSSTYKEDLKGLHNLNENDTITDVVFSRAHYSMALGVAVKAWGNKINPKKAWVVDPTNYVSHHDWNSITLTENIGKILARYPFLKKLKDLVDKFGRQKLPILKSITPPLLYLTENIQKPILSLHIASGNILVNLGKEVVQVITDPHVREDYLANAEKPNMKFCVFDSHTKNEFLQKAAKLGKLIDPEKIIVTGPPIDPRIIESRKHKDIWHHQKKRPLRLCLTTGGLGTNKTEIKKILEQLLPTVKHQILPIELMIYAGTHKDIRDLVIKQAKKHHIRLKKLSAHDPAQFSINKKIRQHSSFSKKLKPHTHLNLLYHPQIVDANELLLQYAFPWADGFITKPSGDMAYDAVAAGCFLITLDEWGEWEHNIFHIFNSMKIAQKIQIKDVLSQLWHLMSKTGSYPTWIRQAMINSNKINLLFLRGSENIIKATVK